MLSPQWLDELRARVTLSSVVMRTTTLDSVTRARSSSSHWGLSMDRAAYASQAIPASAGPCG